MTPDAAPIDRRQFFGIVAGGLGLAAGAPAAPVDVTFDPAQAPEDFADGVQLGASEADRTVHLLGLGVRIIAPRPQTASSPRLSWLTAPEEPGASLSAAGDDPRCTFRTAVPVLERARRLAAWLVRSRHERRAQFIFDPDLTDTAAAIRSQLAIEGLHIVSAAHTSRALDDRTSLAILLSPRPEDITLLREQGLRATLLSICQPSTFTSPSVNDWWLADWHPTFDRYGASEVNERYTRRFNRPMSCAAWHGWVGVKAFTEAVVRARSVTMCANLRGFRFDGHKGALLEFDEHNYLKQPLLLVCRKGEEETVMQVV